MHYEFDFSVITPQAVAVLWRGMLVSLQITSVAMAIGLVLGIVLAMLRMSSVRIVSLLAALYVTAFRSIPLVMVLLWFFLLIPQLLQGVFGLSPGNDIRMTSALIAFSLFEAAYYAEIVRAGIKSVGVGQRAASLALGMTPLQSMRLVVLPQALRNMVPVLLTQGIVLFQDTSLVYVSALADFFGRAYGVGERNGRIIELLMVAGLVYFLICITASQLVRHLSRNLSFR